MCWYAVQKEKSKRRLGAASPSDYMSQIIRGEMMQEITAKLEHVPLQTLADLAMELGTDRSAASIASYLCAKPIQAKLVDDD
jgi:hypothetical protein